jgi:enoyl-CoA hydratase/carnithine racemase
MEFETVLVTGVGPIRHLVLNRPHVHNAFNGQLVRDLFDACLALDTQREVRAVIVRGEGPSLSSGADLKAPRQSSMDAMAASKMGARMIDALTHLNAVTICCCHGFMIGAGAVLPAACDFRLGAPSIRLTLNEVSIGFNLTWNTMPALVQLVGPARAKEMLILGREYGAETLQSYGYLNEVVEEDSLVAAAERYADRIARQPPVPVTVTKASINAYTKALDRSVHHMDHLAVGYMNRSANSRIAGETYFTGEPPEYVDE